MTTCEHVRIPCVHASCKTTTKRKDAQMHQSTCPFEIIYCEYCIKQMPKRDYTHHKKSVCPLFPVKCLCDQTFPRNAVAFHSFLECPEQKVWCPNIGCSEEGLRRLMPAHQKECLYQKQPCRYCNHGVTFGTREIHETNECELRPVPCGCHGCAKMVPFRDRVNHEANCDFRDIECKYCGKILPYQEHQAVCEKAPVKCTYCSCEMERQALFSHEQACPCFPLECTFPDCSTMVERQFFNEHIQNSMVHHIQALCKQVSILATQLTSCQRELMNCQSELTNCKRELTNQPKPKPKKKQKRHL